MTAVVVDSRTWSSIHRLWGRRDSADSLRMIAITAAVAVEGTD